MRYQQDQVQRISTVRFRLALQNLRTEQQWAKPLPTLIIEPSAGRHSLQRHLNSAAHALLYKCDWSFGSKPLSSILTHQLTFSSLPVELFPKLVGRKSPHPLESAAQLSWRDLKSPKTQLEIEEACTIYKGKIQESKTSSKEEEIAAASVKLSVCSPTTLVAARFSC